MKHCLHVTLLVLILIQGQMVPVLGKERFVPLQRFAPFASGSVSGHYFPLALAIARRLNLDDGMDTAIALPTAGSVENVSLLRLGDVRYGFCQADVFDWAVRGELMFDGDPVRSLRAVAALYDETVQLIVREDGEIRSIEDLRGRKLAMGVPGSGSRITGEWILKQSGLVREDIQLTEDGFESGLDALLEKRLDAVLLVSALPNDAVSLAAKKTGLRFVPLPPPKNLQSSPLRVRDIPVDTYPGQEIPIPTLALAAIWVTMADVTADEVENQLRLILADRSTLPVPAGAARTDVFEGIPAEYLHEGALRIKNIR